jgi:ferredoxin
LFRQAFAHGACVVCLPVAKHLNPVLGCNHYPGIKTHAQLSCLGFLAHSELMLLLGLVFKEGVQINLTCCEDCPNGHILDDVYTSHDLLAALLPDNKVALIRERGSLKYQPASLSRRELFGFFRERSTRTANVIVERLQVNSKLQSYGSKQVPLVRSMLLKVMETMPEIQKRVTDQFFGQISFTETCTTCSGCVGVCPTGAIDPAEEDKSPPVFDRNLCVSCGSCQAFCLEEGVQLVAGSSQK